MEYLEEYVHNICEPILIIFGIIYLVSKFTEKK